MMIQDVRAVLGLRVRSLRVKSSIFAIAARIWARVATCAGWHVVHVVDVVQHDVVVGLLERVRLEERELASYM